MLKLLSRGFLAAIIFSTVLFESTPSSTAPALAARTSNEAGVTVIVTPKALGPGVTVWEFDVVMDTHTKPLTDDLAKVAVLVDGAGHRYVPVAWQGDPPGGHHRKGVLQFTAPAEVPKSIELQISGVGGVGSRTFRWELN
jgi:hypothetical protein